MLDDSYGRTATDLRVSVTDRCDLRCTYCLPAEGLSWLPWPGLTGIVSRVARLRPRPGLSLTTNAVGLARLAGPLRAVGLDRVNVSLDPLDRATFARLTRRRRLDDVPAGLAAATAGLAPVKVNTVLMRGVNGHEAPALLRFCPERGYRLRFIEQMPLDAQHGWDRSQMVTAAEILARLSPEFSLTPVDSAERAGAPAEEFEVDAGQDQDQDWGRGRVGIIASVTRPFCGACDRVRLTADGQVRNCLFTRQESDLRGLLRSRAERIAAAWERAVAARLPGHGISEPGFLQPARPMSAIGG